MPQPLLVAVGVITNSDGEILIAKRPNRLEQGGLWELPGGKLAPYETGLQALKREITEEVGLKVEAARPLIRISHTYPNNTVLLDVWKVLKFSGTPKGLEGQPIRWVSQASLVNYCFPQANLPIFQAIQLPEILAINPTSTNLITAQQLTSQLPEQQANLPLMISCRNLEEVEAATNANPNCLLLDFSSSTGFNWQLFSDVTQTSNLPCYALSELPIEQDQLTRVFGLGGQGLAYFA